MPVRLIGDHELDFLIRRMFLATAVLGLMIGAAGRAGAAFVVDSGTPNHISGLTGIVVSQNPYVSQFAAQQFTLASDTQVSTIEVYLGGNSSSLVHVDLATAIGPAATLANRIASFTLPNPGTTSTAGAWVSSSLDAQLAAGTYYLVFSIPLNLEGDYLPVAAPNQLGTTYYVIDGINITLPIASDFVSLSAGYEIGVRISGSSVVPEPSSLTLCGIAGLSGLGFAWRRRERSA